MRPLNPRPYKGQRGPLAVLCCSFFLLWLFYLFIYFRERFRQTSVQESFHPPPTVHRLCPPGSPSFHQPGFTAVHRFSISSRLFRQDVHPSVLSVRRLFFNAPSSTKWKMIAIEAPTLPFHLLIIWWISKIPADDWSKTSELISPERTFCLWWLGSLSLKCYVIHTVARSSSSASL